MTDLVTITFTRLELQQLAELCCDELGRERANIRKGPLLDSAFVSATLKLHRGLLKLEGAMLPNRFVFPPWAFKALLDKLTPVLTQTQAKATRTRVVSAATPASGADTPGRSGGAAGTDARHDAADAIDAPALPFKEAV